MFYEATFQPSEKMNYNADAKRLAGKKVSIFDLIMDHNILIAVF